MTRATFTRMAFNLQSVLKAFLFSTGQPLSVKDIQAAFARFHAEAGLPPAPAPVPTGVQPTEPAAGPAAEPEPPETEAGAEPSDDPDLYAEVPSLVTAAQIREAMDAIAAELRAGGGVSLLIEGSRGWRLATQPRFARWVRLLRAEPPPARLSPSALETLAVVAYRQPVTRSELEAIRGVSADAGLTKLLERELIEITGRADQPGRPLQYGTTDDFLEFVGVKSLDELPASDVLSSRQIDGWLSQAMNPAHPGDAEMGLAQEDLPLGTATMTGDGAMVRELPAATEPPAAAVPAVPGA